MASGSSGRPNSGSKGFDFASDDVLCSYEDYINNQDASNGGHSSDPVVGTNSSKDFHKSRMTRSSVFPATSYSQPEDSFNQDVSSIVEKSMKKYADNLMRFLEGISSRLSQLELYCYNVDKSIGEMRSDLARDHEEADSKLKSLEKHLQEVHRSVQILRDKQELADTQKELAKLQLVQKESSSSSQSQSNEEKYSPPASDAKKTENSLEVHNQQLALALPHQVAPPQQPIVFPSQPAPQNVIQQQPYYLTANQLPTPVPHSQHSQSQYLPSDPQYRTSPMQEMSRVPQPAQSQVNQTPPVQSFPQYQQQWPQQVPQQVPPPQQPSIQPQVRPQSSTVYPSYPTGQSTNASPETLPSSMSMQVPFSSTPQPVSSRADAMPYGYTAAGRTGPQQPTQQVKVPFGVQPGDGYAVAGPHQGLPPPPGSAYMMYDSEGARAHHQPQQPHFPQGGYPPTNLSLQNPQPSAAAMVQTPNHSQFTRNHPLNELIEKLVSMGFRGDHVVSVIQRMEESGQLVDFNSVLDRLNVHSSGSSQPQRGW
ncbi:putative structural constituent of cell wall [Tripterygium wilfordii]|uniref:Putative structural constituent of cell wall n=1 Tax=Tripterygium wilfordii TaxID=458696 RepID=A0A7J7DHX3_TRIWF|nr:arginine-glutamic acid dipeptide repeats protein [Tripterygium wilfordii]KAF5745952.1 putative structural constituent of cell wall [Tripterygium wilfordii]